MAGGYRLNSDKTKGEVYREKNSNFIINVGFMFTNGYDNIFGSKSRR